MHPFCIHQNFSRKREHQIIQKFCFFSALVVGYQEKVNNINASNGDAINFYLHRVEKDESYMPQKLYAFRSGISSSVFYFWCAH